MTTKRIICTLALSAMLGGWTINGYAQTDEGNASQPLDAAGKPRPAEQSLQGAWLVTFTPSSYSTPPFASLATFSPESGMTNTAAGLTLEGVLINAAVSQTRGQGMAIPPGEFCLPGSASTGVGAWVTTSSHAYALTYIHLVYDCAGQYIGLVKVRASLKIYREATDQFNGQYVCDMFNRRGERVLTLDGKIEGRRIFVEPLTGQ